MLFVYVCTDVLFLCIFKSSFQFFEDFVNYKFTERELDAVFSVAIWPQASDSLMDVGEFC